MMSGYAGTPSAESEIETLSNFPTGCQERYSEEQYARGDPVARYRIDSLAPLRVVRNGRWPAS